MHRGLPGPKGPVVAGHQVGAGAALPVDLDAGPQGHRVLPVAADQARGLPGRPPSLDQRKVAAPTAPVVWICTTKRRFSWRV